MYEVLWLQQWIKWTYSLLSCKWRWQISKPKKGCPIYPAGNELHEWNEIVHIKHLAQCLVYTKSSTNTIKTLSLTNCLMKIKHFLLCFITITWTMIMAAVYSIPVTYQILCPGCAHINFSLQALVMIVLFQIRNQKLKEVNQFLQIPRAIEQKTLGVFCSQLPSSILFPLSQGSYYQAVLWQSALWWIWQAL